MTSPARRVLGDKDKNAFLKIRSPKSTLGPQISARTSTSTLQKPSKMVQTASSPQAGSKRKIEEVEDAERVEQPLLQDSQRTQLLSDSETDDDRVKRLSSNVQISHETAETSFSASQPQFEPQFEIPQDEMSQRTLENLNAVPMPQNTSQLPPTRPNLLKEVSAGSVGLSNFINFEGPPSTQGSDAMQMLEEINKNQDKNSAVKDTTIEEATEAAARKKMLEGKAAELRTRLQLALYKVETKQTSQPFSRLKTPRPQREASSSPPTAWLPMLGTPQLSSSTIKQPSSARTIAPPDQADPYDDSAEAHIASMRARAANQLKPPVRDLNSLPMPVLDPALMDAGRSFDSNRTQQIADNQSQGSQQFPSSPPLSRLPSSTSEVGLLPGIHEAADKQENVQLSSPPMSEGRVSKHSIAKAVSQGEAASGLVALMTGSSG